MVSMSVLKKKKKKKASKPPDEDHTFWIDPHLLGSGTVTVPLEEELLALPCLAFYFETDREETDVRHIDGIIYYNFDAICSSAERLINIRLGT